MKEKNQSEKISNAAKLDVIFRSFPRIKEFYRERNFKKVVILNIDLDLLAKDCDYYSSETIEHHFGRSIALFDKNGGYQGIVGQREVIVDAKPDWKLFGLITMKGEPERKVQIFFNETVGDAIKRIGIENVAFVTGFLNSEPETLFFAHSGKKTIKQALEDEKRAADEVLMNEIVVPSKA